MATARAESERERREAERGVPEPEALTESPGALTHGAPDVELADAQLALGRPELTQDSPEVDDAELAAEAVGGNGRSGGGRGGPGDSGDGEAGDLAPTDASASERRGVISRLSTFLLGSWRELQRVQWPDRRQVMQATGVVIGFVIVAGLYLGLADTVATKLVNLVLQ
ncbi:MAG: preprotein translocase subunit SecE [Actinomycetota bacterium]|nr:preprotein translocase subunit SecE [Actinomycetota bacterium]